MSPTSSLRSTEGFMMPSKLRQLYSAQRPVIKISFENPKKTYTTLDRLEGCVSITAPIDTHFDAVDIEFVGTSRTFVERMTTAHGATGRSEAFHQFLKLSQPGTEEFCPPDLMFRAGVQYDFPFVFAIPQQLLPRVCQHVVQNEAVRDEHLRLPPTFGDKDLATRQKSLDDMAPDMASVRYGIFAKVSELKIRGDEVWRSTMVSKARRVRVIPVIEELPPLAVNMDDNSEYVMRKEKTIRKGMLKGKAGTLVMEAAQPPALQVKSYDNPESRTNTHATIMLRYDPLDEAAKPPKLGNLASRLKVSTFFASCARHGVPSKTGALMDLTQGIHSEQINLSSRCMANVEWVRHAAPAYSERRDSATSMHSVWTGGVPEPSESYKGGSYFTARLLVPVQLPANKACVPTFHSCLISRMYTLKFELNIASGGIGPSMDLKIPVQVSTAGLVGDELDRRDSIDAGAEIDVDDLFEPRTIRVPDGGFIGRSRIGSQAPVAPSPPRSDDGAEQEQENDPDAVAQREAERDAERLDAPAAVLRRAESDDAPPGYTPMAGMMSGRARMTGHRAMSVPVY